MSHAGINNADYNPQKEKMKLSKSQDGVTVITYPAGEIQVSLSKQKLRYISNTKAFDVRCLGEHSHNVMALMQAAEIIKHNLSGAQITLRLPYMPFSRQDRRVSHGTASSLKIFGKAINQMGFWNVETFDPHSDVCEAVVDNLIIKSNADLVQYALDNHAENEIVFLSPDAGAEKKIYSLLRILDLAGISYRVETASKIRNVLTGDIELTKVPDGLEGQTIFIVDDICDGGRTFIEISKALPADTKKHLVVTHGIFSKGLEVVLDHFDSVTTTDSFPQVENPKLNVIGI